MGIVYYGTGEAVLTCDGDGCEYRFQKRRITDDYDIAELAAGLGWSRRDGRYLCQACQKRVDGRPMPPDEPPTPESRLREALREIDPDLVITSHKLAAALDSVRDLL